MIRIVIATLAVLICIARPAMSQSDSCDAATGTCVSTNGNVTQFAGHIGATSAGEGYILCDVDTGYRYYDLGGLGAAGFGPSTTTIQNTFPYTVTRTTLDGAYVFKQTFSLNATEKGTLLQITMKTLNEKTNRLHAHVKLWRYADMNTNGSASGDNVGQTTRSVFAWKDPGGLMLGAFGTASTTTAARVVGSTADPATCNVQGISMSPLPPPDNYEELLGFTLDIGYLRVLTQYARYRAF